MDTVKTVETPYNNAVSIFNRTNELLNENNIKDSTGEEIAQLEQIASNPAWLYALACGSLHTSWQEKIAKAYAALDPANCEEDQVLVLASLAGIERGNGTPSHITVLLTNTSNESVTIPINTIFSETYTNHTWAVNKTFNLASASEEGHSVIATLYSIDDGAFSVPKSTSFTNDDFTAVTCVSQSASAEGEDIETIASLRNRLVQGTETADFITQAKNAIELLSGVESCSIWFNSSPSDNLYLGSKTIPPRNAYLVIKGTDVSEKIAETYFHYLDVPANVGEITESYLRGQQALEMSFDVASEKTVNVWVKILSTDAAVGAASAIKDKIATYSGTLDCGQNLTAQQVSEWIQNLGYGTVIGCNVGTSTGLISDIEPDEICVFTADDISVTEV